MFSHPTRRDVLFRGVQLATAAIVAEATASEAAFSDMESNMIESSAMRTGNEIASSSQWRAYLDRHPDLEAETAELELTDQLWTTIKTVNAMVNTERWVPEEGDDWGHSLPGDCENFALLKRKLLAEKGVPLGAMRVCVGQIRRRGRSQGHAVLHIVTDRGDYVLDNLTDEIVPWEKSRVKPLYRTAGGGNYQIAVLS